MKPTKRIESVSGSAERSSDERFRVIFESVNVGILVIAVDGYAFIDANERICEMFGYTHSEILALDVARLSADVSSAALVMRAALRERAIAGEAFLFEWECARKGGTRFWTEVAVRRAVFEGRDVFLLTAQDITKRRAAQDGMAFRDRILHAVTASVAELVEEPSLDDAMSHVLRAVGEALDVDRLSVFEVGHFPGDLPVSLLFTWQRSPDLPTILSTFPLHGGERAEIAAWMAPLALGKPVITYADGQDGFANRLMHDLQTKSILMVPIEVDGQFWGQVGVDDGRSARRWSSVEIEALDIFARVIGALVAQREARTKLERSEARFRTVSDTVLDAIIMIGTDGRIVYWNHAAEQIFGYSADEAKGKPIHEWLASPRFRDKADHGMVGFAADGHGAILGTTLELAAVRKDGREIAIELSVNAMTVGAERYAVGVARDVTERKRANALIERMARFDILTGLPNRRLFIEALEKAISRQNRYGEGFAVLYLDLDHFKDVNDTLGHPVGDVLLQRVAERLHESVRDIDTVARFGGDEFAAVAIDIGEPADAAVLAEKIVRAIDRPFDVEGVVIHTGTCIGIAVYGPESPNAEALLSHADVALYRAKDDGGSTYRFYTDAMNAEVRERVALDAELAEAVEAGQFVVLYQPQVDIETGRIVGLEALVRWNHPARGLLGPAAFIVAAERCGAIVPMGRIVLHQACSQMRRWIDAGIAPPLIAINVSGIQFRVPCELEDALTSVLAESGVPAQRVEIELTESVLMEASRSHNAALLTLRDMGLRVAIDDFGTGYSSLDYLRRFQVQRIKIPGSFITDLTTVPSNGAIVRASFGLARELDIEVVVEGVETDAQMQLLRGWGCRVVQGFYFSEPVPVAEATALLRAGMLVPAHPDRALNARA
jgi:diguanylate cyclase (GGDEF)-like protein/PAS domain S-box-containing protein